MPAKAERIKVEVTDSTEGATRTFNIMITVSTSDFQLSDLLQQRGVISGLNGEPKHAVRVATDVYLIGEEALIATLKHEPTTAVNTRSNGNRKARHGTRKAPTGAETSELNKGVAPVLPNKF